MIREFHLADFFTLANGACGIGGVFCAMKFLETQIVSYFLIAAALAPNAVGYLVAAHAGSFTHGRILAHLGLHPVFDIGLGHGEGTGAAMTFALIDHMAAIVRQG